VEALEAQASNLKGFLTSSTPPPVATDENLWKLWAEFGFAAFRIIYNLGVAHGQASSREVADPALLINAATEFAKQLYASHVDVLNQNRQLAVREIAAELVAVDPIRAGHPRHRDEANLAREHPSATPR